ncbi:MAG: DUF2911 domain-containing protein [Saprospiraceae bacterium]
MKNILFIVFAICMTIGVHAQISTPAASPAATVTQEVGLAKVTIEYSRPSLKGRKMFGSDFIPTGKVWRTGANKVPNLIISQEVMIAGNKVPAGTYGILSIPTEKQWTIILSKNAGQWGAYAYTESEDFLRFTVPVKKLKEKEEHFTMGFTKFKETSANVFISWENQMVMFEISQNPHETIMAEIATKTKAADVSMDTYFGAAEYYFANNHELNKAYEWADKVVNADKQYWTYFLRGKIAAKIGKCDVAKSDAMAGLEMAKKASDGAYVKNLEGVLAACK